MNSPAQIQIFSRVSFIDKLLFTKHLSVMVKAGISLTEGIETLRDQTKSKAFKNILTSVLTDITNGQSMAKSLSKYPKVFDQFYVSLIEIGEESGTLEQNLVFLAKQLSKEYALKKKF